MTVKKMTRDEWRAEGTRLFGPDETRWKFICPWCEHPTTVEDWRNVGAPPGAVAFSCVGRWMNVKPEVAVKKGEGPCMYSGGGMINQNPIEVDDQRLFAFAGQILNQNHQQPGR